MTAQVEEVTASAHSLAELASALQGVVEQFKLESGPRGSNGAKSGGVQVQKSGMKTVTSGNGHRIVSHN